VRFFKGVVLSDELRNPEFANADYWFPEFQVVAELKCLTEDLSKKEDFNKQVAQLHASWVRKRLLPNMGETKTKLNFRAIPPQCAREFLNLVKKKLESSVIRKANRQIRETKAYMQAPSAQGLLLIVNDGNFMFSPGVMTHMLARMMRGQYSSINSVIYFSVNEAVSIPGVKMPSLFWFDCILPKRQPVSPAFRKGLQKAWMAHYSGLVPGLVFELGMKNDPDIVDNIQFK